MGQPADVLTLTLPASTRLVLERVERTSAGLAIRVHGRCRRRPPRPGCGCSSVSRHGHYQRELTDVPWLGCRVKLLLKVRRFRCGNAKCSRRTFAEQMPGVAALWGRATLRLSQLMRRVGLRRGWSRRLPPPRGLRCRDARRHDPASSQGAVRPGPHGPKGLRVLGVDDWAWRKHQHYGTILMDLERRRVIDLLPVR